MPKWRAVEYVQQSFFISGHS